MTFTVTNPATGQVAEAFNTMDESDTQASIDASADAFREWRRTDLSHRAALMHAVAWGLESEKTGHARLMALEMGKPIGDGAAEIEKCAWLCRYYADHADEMLKPRPAATDAANSYVMFAPLGVLLGVMPWNYPFWQVFRFAVPALMAGNTVLLKHAASVPGCALAIQAAMQKAGFPEAVFQSLMIPSDRVQQVLAHPDVRAVTLTGSRSSGSAVAAQAGAMIKKSVLELGGSDPYLILADADLDTAVDACVSGRLLNSGQSCIAAKRIITVGDIRREFEKRLVEKMKAIRVGDPLNEQTEVGPLAGSAFRDTLHRQVRKSIDQGAHCLLGGKIPEGEGFFYPVTVLTDVRPGMPVFDEETFGPVAAVIAASSESEAIDLANGSDYGLGAAVFTRDIERGERIAAQELDAGNAFVNAFVKSDPRLPFGGIKQSGFGRELSHYGIESFVNVKTVYVA